MALPSDKDLVEQFRQHQKYSERGLALQHSTALESQAFFAGDYMTYEASVQDKGRKRTVVFNKVKPFVSSVAGFMIQLRRQPKYQAKLEESEQQSLFSEHVTAFSDYIRDNGNFDQLESRQDLEMLITGYGAIDTNISWEFNPDGEARGEVLECNDVFWDAESREKNVLDSRWVFRRKKFGREEAMELFDRSDPSDFEDADSQGNNRNYIYNPAGGVYDKIAFEQDSTDEDLVNVYSYQYWEREDYWRMRNPLFELEKLEPNLASALFQMMTKLIEKRKEVEEDESVIDDLFDFDPKAEFLVMNQTIYNDVKTLFERFDIKKTKAVAQKRRVYYTAILSGTKVFRKFKSPDQQGFTIKFKTGDWDKHNNMWFGMVGVLKEPAKYSNKAFTEILYVIASNSKGGVMYEKSAVDNPVRFEQQMMKTDAAIRVNDGALSGGMIQPKAQASLPSGYENVLTIANNALTQAVGVSPEFLGSSENKQVSALLESQRIEQVVTALAGYFDAITLYQKEHARLMFTFMKMLSENSQGRLIRIMGEDGALKFEELMADRFMTEYDIEIMEAPDSATQKRDKVEMMTKFADSQAQFGINIYPAIVDLLPIAQSDKQKIKEIMQPKDAQPDPMEEELKRIALEAQRKDLENTMADTQLKLASADNKQADSAKKLVEAEQKDVETEIALRIPVSDTSINLEL